MASLSSRALVLAGVVSLSAAACATATVDEGGRGSEATDGGPKPPPATLPDAAEVTGRPDARPGGGDEDGGLADAGGCTAETIDLLVNGNFDAGRGAPWVEASSGGFPLVLAEGDEDLPFVVPPDSGTFISYLGGYNNAVDQLHQDVTLPADASVVRLRGVFRIDTEETVQQPFDVLFIEIRSTADELFEELARVDNLDDTADQFVRFDIPVTAALPVQTIRVQVRDTTDVSLLTHFFFDTLQLEVTTCAGAAGLPR